MSAPPTAPPAAPAAPVSAPTRAWTAVLVVIVGLLAAVALPFAPVLAERATVTWPGDQLARSTTAFFAPYRPATLTATVPCGTGLFATGPDGAGLAVRAVAGGTQVELDGRVVASAPGCGVTVTAGPGGVDVDLAGTPTALPGVPVPEVMAFRTEAPAAGLSVTATTATPWQSSPTPLKLALIALQLLAALLALALLARRAPCRRVAFRQPGRRLPRLLLDLGVVAVLVGWAVVGPLSDDDGFATTIARSVLDTGDAGNSYRWWNASETPFALSQQLLAAWLAVSPAPLWLRIPSTVLGIVTWLVVSRGVLGVLAPGRLGVRALAAVFLLAAWLPFDLGVRPEPWVACGVVTVLALLLRARGPAGIGVAALVAGVTVPLSPTGLLVLAPVLACVPRIRRVLCAGATPREVAVRVGLVAVAGAVAMAVVFADQTWHGVLVATQVHTGFGPSLPWYAEPARYEFLLRDDFSGSFAKRLPVLLALALLGTAAATILRRGRGALGDGTALLAVTVGLAFLLLVPLPSKWSHHFGAMAGLIAPFLALAVAGLWRSGGRAGVLGAVAVSAAAAVAFAGPNAWWQPVNYPVPWAAEPVRPGGLPLDSPLQWLALGVAVAAVLTVRRAGSDSARSPAGLLSRSGSAPAAIAAVAAGTAVAVLLGTFGTAPLRRPGGYTLAQANVDRLTGAGACALADGVQVLPDSPGGVLQPVGDGPAAPGWVAGGGYRPDLAPFDPPGQATSRFLWGSHGSAATGELVGPWFGLPALDGRQVALSIAGRVGDGTSLELEFGRGDAGIGRVAPAAANTVDPAEPVDDELPGRQPRPVPATLTWRTVAVDSAEVPAGADRVRIRAVDAATDPDGWLATTGPRLRDVVALRDFLAVRGPVLVDWPLAFLLPCVLDRPRVAGGLAAAPAVRVMPPETYAGLAGIATDRGQGGSFLGVGTQARAVEVPTRLVGAPDLEWGHLVLLDHGLALDTYRVTRAAVVTWGWQAG